MWWKPWTWFATSATVTREPEWTLDELNWTLAARAYEAAIGPHGQPLVEATSAEANPANDEGAYFYRAGKPIIDWALRTQLQATARMRKNLQEGESMDGYHIPVEKVWRDQR